MIVADNREPAVIACLPSGTQIQQLDIGDFTITHSEKLIVVERKSWSDLKASFNDGRYSEQKARLLAARDRDPANVSIVYILEGSVPRISAEKQSRAAALKMAVRDGIAVVYSADPSETAKVILYLDKCLIDGSLDSAARATIVAASGYAGIVQHSKKRANAEANMAATILTAIPGVSGAKAAAIVELYPTIATLIKAFEEGKSLADIECGKRRLGPALNESIRKALF
jgi:ERCC4-type nuclease